MEILPKNGTLTLLATLIQPAETLTALVVNCARNTLILLLAPSSNHRTVAIRVADRWGLVKYTILNHFGSNAKARVTYVVWFLSIRLIYPSKSI